MNKPPDKQALSDRPLEERLALVPPDRLRPEVRNRVAKLCRGMDELARLDEETQQVYIDEPSLRRLFGEEFAPEFVDRYVAVMRGQPGSDLRADAGAKGRGRTRKILWQTYVNRVVKDVPPGETFEGLGLSGSSTNEDVRRAVKARHPELPDSLFEPATADRLREAIDRLTAEAREEAAGPAAARREAAGAAVAQTSYLWEPFSQCFGKVFFGNVLLVVFGVFTLTMILTGFNWVVSLIAAAAGLAIWLVWSLVWCVLQAVFG